MEDGRTERVRGFSRHTLAFERRSPPERSDARAPRDHSVFCDNTRQSYPITISAHRYLKQQPLDALRGGSRGGGDARVGLAARQRRERPLERGGVTLGDGQARRARQEREHLQRLIWGDDMANNVDGLAVECCELAGVVEDQLDEGLDVGAYSDGSYGSGKIGWLP